MKNEGRARWWQWNKRRQERDESDMWDTVKERVTASYVTTVVCPRCRREVRDNERGRQAHGVSCVRIPARRSRLWGVKTKATKR